MTGFPSCAGSGSDVVNLCGTSFDPQVIAENTPNLCNSRQVFSFVIGHTFARSLLQQVRP
jgi:hypothetical protein